MSETMSETEQTTQDVDLGSAINNLWALSSSETVELLNNWPSLLDVAGVPDSVESWRLRVIQVYAPALADFCEELYFWKVSREDCEAIVIERVFNEMDNCDAFDADEILEFCFQQLVMSEAEFAAQKAEREVALDRIRNIVLARLVKESVQDAKEAVEAVEATEATQ